MKEGYGMKFNMKRMLVFALLAVVFTGVLSWNAIRVQADSEPFTVGGVGYTTFAEAVGAIESATDKTIVLAGDAEITGEVLLSGYSLDLAGHSLTCNGTIVGTAGTNLLDSSEGKTGLLKCSKDSLTLSADNTYVPVWNGEGYIFVQPNVTATYQMFDTSLTEDGSYRFYFRPGFGKVNDGATSVATAYLGQYDQDLEMSFELYYSKDTYVTTATEGRNCIDSLSFSNAYVKDAYANGKVFYVRVENAGDYRYLGIKTVIESCGVRYTSEEFVGKNVFLNADASTEKNSSNYWDTLNGRTYPVGTNGLELKKETDTPVNYNYSSALKDADNIILEMKISGISVSSSGYFELSFNGNNANNGRSSTDDYYIVKCYNSGMIRFYGSNNLVVPDDGLTEIELKVFIDNVTKKATVHNVTKGTVSTYDAPVLTTGELAFIKDSASTATIEYVKVYTDAGLTVGEFLKDMKVNKTVTWTWDDSDDNDLLRPETITVGVYNGSTKVAEQEVSAAGGTCTFENLPEYNADGTQIAYTASTEVAGYTVSGDGLDMTLSHTPVITWNYNNDFEGTGKEVNRTGSNENCFFYDAAGRGLNNYKHECDIYTEDDGNKCLEFVNVAEKNAELRRTMTSTSVIVSFRIRLKDETVSVPVSGSNGVHFRLTTTSYFANLKGQTLWIGNDTTKGVTLTTSWQTIKVEMNTTTGEATCWVNGTATTIAVDKVTPAIFSIYAQSTEAFSGLLIDDLQIYSVAESAEQ